MFLYIGCTDRRLPRPFHGNRWNIKFQWNLIGYLINNCSSQECNNYLLESRQKYFVSGNNYSDAITRASSLRFNFGRQITFASVISPLEFCVRVIDAASREFCPSAARWRAAASEAGWALTHSWYLGYQF